MSFHPSKCQVLRVTNKKKELESSYSIRGHPLEVVNSAKYLGVTISNNMTWKTHINNVTAKGKRTLSFLQRNLYHCAAEIKERSYKTLVRPQLEYCAPVWDPHHMTHIKQLEAVQNRAARFVSNDYARYSSVTAMKQELGWESLQARRKLSKATILYKSINNLVDVNIPLRESPNNPGKYIQIYRRTTTYLKSYVPDTIIIWNGLSAATRSAQSLQSFRLAAAAELYQKF